MVKFLVFIAVLPRLHRSVAQLVDQDCRGGLLLSSLGHWLDSGSKKVLQVLGFVGVSAAKESTCKRKKNLPAMRETWVLSLGWEDPLEKGTATHSSILAWKIPWTV